MMQGEEGGGNKKTDLSHKKKASHSWVFWPACSIHFMFFNEIKEKNYQNVNVNKVNFINNFILQHIFF